MGFTKRIHAFLYADSNAHGGHVRAIPARQEGGLMDFFRKTAAVALLFLMCLSAVSPACAAGSGNVDGGGGSLNKGTEDYYWPDVGYDGVRVTVVDAETGQRVSVPVDYTNLDIGSLPSDICHFGESSKLDYRNGASLSPQAGGYECKKPEAAIPQIISGNNSKASIPAIRRYFCSEAAATMVAGDTGVPFEDIEGGKYKIAIEPVIYLVYEGKYFAMTATEAGLYNQMTGGDFGSHFPTVVMKNLALALFLERDDLGFEAWEGATGSARTTEQMIDTLGIGIISYKGAPVTTITYDREYRVDTDVIVSVRLTTAEEKSPDSPAYAKFKINGVAYTHKDIYIPEDGFQLAWVKWHTPAEPGEVTIEITSNCATSNSKFTAMVVDMGDNPPPDPQADDRYDGFCIPAAPEKPDARELAWGEWACQWHENNVWHSDIGEDGVDNGEWVDEGWWVYTWKSYSASLSAALSVEPDEKDPTASGRVMKSGYGLGARVSATVSSSAPSSHITGAQNVVAYFPEFDYGDYWRLLERLDTGYSSTYGFQANQYSTYGRRVHFSPVWFPDGDYVPYVEVLDAWTPAGMLQVNLTDTLAVNGSLFDDWHIRPVQ